MKSCIIGGAGFIGFYLVKALLDSGREVVVLDRSQPKENQLIDGVKYELCDYSDTVKLTQILQGCNEIVDLAYSTVPKTSFEDPIFDLQSNLPPSIALLDTARSLDSLERLLIVSSGGTIYGHVERLPISEENAAQPVSPYGITKLTIERYALMFNRLHGVPVTIVRPANAYGIGQKPFSGQGFVATAMGHILRRDEVVVFGKNGTIRDYIHVSDIARGILAALAKGASGEVYNIGSGVGRSNIEVLNTIEPLAKAANLEIKICYQAERRFDVPANILNFGKLLSCSGWLPTVRFEDGIAEMWDFFLKGCKV